MPRSNQLNSPGAGPYEVIRTSGVGKLVAFAVGSDGSGNPVWRVGRCDDEAGNGFVAVFEVNVVTSEVKIGGVTLVVP